jgi:hypothetical protein
MFPMSIEERISELKKLKQFERLGYHLRRSHQKMELVFVEDFEWKKSTYEGEGILNNLLYNTRLMTLAFLGGFMLLFIMFTIVRVSVDVIGVFAFIFSIFIIIYLMYDYSKKYQYLELKPLSRSALESIYDADRVEEMEDLLINTADKYRKLKNSFTIALADSKANDEIAYFEEWNELLQGTGEFNEVLKEAKKMYEDRKKKNVNSSTES